MGQHLQFNLKEYKERSDQFSEAMRLAPTESNSAMNCGNLHQKMADLAETHADFDTEVSDGYCMLLVALPAALFIKAAMSLPGLALKL